jgi:hypothetical protein
MRRHSTLEIAEYSVSQSPDAPEFDNFVSEQSFEIDQTDWRRKSREWRLTRLMTKARPSSANLFSWQIWLVPTLGILHSSSHIKPPESSCRRNVLTHHAKHRQRSYCSCIPTLVWLGKNKGVWFLICIKKTSQSSDLFKGMNIIQDQGWSSSGSSQI